MTTNERAKKLVKIYQNERALENAEEKLQGALVNYKLPEVKTLDAVIQRCSASEDGFDEVEEIEPEAGDDGDPGEFLDDEDAEEPFHLMVEPAPAYGDDDTAVTVESDGDESVTDDEEFANDNDGAPSRTGSSVDNDVDIEEATPRTRARARALEFEEDMISMSSPDATPEDKRHCSTSRGRGRSTRGRGRGRAGRHPRPESTRAGPKAPETELERERAAQIARNQRVMYEQLNAAPLAAFPGGPSGHFLLPTPGAHPMFPALQQQHQFPGLPAQPPGGAVQHYASLMRAHHQQGQQDQQPSAAPAEPPAAP